MLRSYNNRPAPKLTIMCIIGKYVLNWQGDQNIIFDISRQCCNKPDTVILMVGSFCRDEVGVDSPISMRNEMHAKMTIHLNHPVEVVNDFLSI